MISLIQEGAYFLSNLQAQLTEIPSPYKSLYLPNPNTSTHELLQIVAGYLEQLIG